MSTKIAKLIGMILCPAIVLVAVLMLILSLTAYREKSPITTVEGLFLRDLDISRNVPTVCVDLYLSVRNRNKAAFKSTEGTAVLFYRGVVVGETPIDVGKIPRGATKTMNVTLTTSADRFQGNPAVGWEVRQGTLPFNIYTKISGKVKVLNMVKARATSVSLCGFDVNFRSKTIGNMRCT